VPREGTAVPRKRTVSLVQVQQKRSLDPPNVGLPSLPRDTHDAAEPAPVVYVVSREGLSSVFYAQVLRPLAEHSRSVPLQLVVSHPIGHWLRRAARQQLRTTAEQAALLNIDLANLPSAPSRARWLWNDSSLIGYVLRKRFPRSARIVVHARGVGGTRIALQLRKWFPHAKVIFDCRGAGPAETRELYEHRGEATAGHALRQVNLAEHAERIAVTNADHILCVSRAMQAYLSQKYELSDEYFTVVPCCVDSKHFEEASIERTALRRDLKLDDQLVIAYNGALEWYQRPDLSLRIFGAFRQLYPRAHFLALTPSAERMRELCKVAGLTKNDHSILSLRHEEVPRYLGAADIGLLPRAESVVNRVASPVKFAEYLACGLPVVLSEAVGDYSELVREARVGLVLESGRSSNEWPEIQALRKFVESYTLDPATWRRRCQHVARTHLDFNIYLPIVRSVYDRLAERR
jgi:glycosyltransferase involved in cell wall biosynthesis